MTRKTNARIAGVTFLLYIVVGVAGMIFLRVPSTGAGIAAKLTDMAAHSSLVQIDILQSFLICFIAIALAVSLFGITRDEDIDLAMMIVACRVIEAALGIVSIFATLALLWLATTAGPDAPDAASAHALGAFLRKILGWNFSVSATFFAVGSTIFSYLLLRGRMVPLPLAWLGLVASVLLVLVLPLQLVDLVGGTGGFLLWLPMLVFEVTIAFWLIIKGVAVSSWTDHAGGGTA